MGEKILTAFYSRLRPGQEAEYAPMAAKTLALAKAIPSFISFKNFTSSDGERVSIIEFAPQKAHAAWRNHRDHRAAQKLGREKFYSAFQIEVCAVVRAHDSTKS